MVLALAQGPAVVQVGRVSAVYWPGHAAAAAALAELADQSGPWPDLPPAPPGRMRLILAGTPARFDSLTGGRAPRWSVAVAFPASNTIVLRMSGDVRRALRHELAHLALHAAVPRVPRWFDEGYAAVAAGEWSRLDVLRVNLALAVGRVPTLEGLNALFRGGAPEAETAYALAASAVLLLRRAGGERGLEPLFTALRGGSPDFDAALRRGYTITQDGFEAFWQRDLKSRYGWLALLSSLSFFWGAVGLALAGAWYWRRRRDRARRQALDQGWPAPPEDFGSGAPESDRGDGPEPGGQLLDAPQPPT